MKHGRLLGSLIAGFVLTYLLLTHVVVTKPYFDKAIATALMETKRNTDTRSEAIFAVLQELNESFGKLEHWQREQDASILKLEDALTVQPIPVELPQ